MRNITIYYFLLTALVFFGEDIIAAEAGISTDSNKCNFNGYILAKRKVDIRQNTNSPKTTEQYFFEVEIFDYNQQSCWFQSDYPIFHTFQVCNHEKEDMPEVNKGKKLKLGDTFTAIARKINYQQGISVDCLYDINILSSEQ